MAILTDGTAFFGRSIGAGISNTSCNAYNGSQDALRYFQAMQASSLAPKQLEKIEEPNLLLLLEDV